MSVSALKQRQVIWEPLPGPQTEFLAETARECLLGGSVGGGKTDCLLMAAVSQTANLKHKALFLRRSFPQLRDAIARSHELFRPLGAEFNRQESMWRFPSGAQVELSFLDAPEDMYRYTGRQFSAILWDELTLWPGDSMDNEGQPVNGAYVYMTSRLRATEGSGLRLEIRGTCTPGGVGAGWVKSRFNIPDDGSSSEAIDKATGYRRRFIRATIADNKYLANTAYARSLESLPAAQHRALVEGRWDSYEGQVFSEWNFARHTCREFALPESWDAWLGADDGYSAPACVLLFAYDKTHDRVFIMDEIYERGLMPEELALATLQMCERHGRDGLDGVIDNSAFAEIGLGNESGKGSRGHIMNSLGCQWKPSTKGAGSRVQGVSAVHQRLALADDGYGKLIVCRNCRNLIRTLPAMTYDRTHPEDIDPACEEHAVKALMYGLTRRKTWSGMTKVRGL